VTGKPKLPPETDAFRWLDEADQTLDVFGEVGVLSLYRDRRPADEAALAARLAAEASLTSIYLKRRPREAHGTDAAHQAPAEPIWGPAADRCIVREASAKFEIRPANGLSVGLYLDSRDARAWVRKHAEGRRVLNLFAYTCGFGIAARLGKAARAVNVDLSRKVLDWGEQNHALNGLTVDRRDFIAGDCFDWLARFAKKSEQFDLVVIDPPSFSNADGRRFRAEIDYPQLVAGASAVLAKGGALLACCNLEVMTHRRLSTHVESGLKGRPATQLASFGASSSDFRQPSALKVLAVEVR
jgi:23S rRNA (cytosine1962-C5)-methyltransferase